MKLPFVAPVPYCVTLLALSIATVQAQTVVIGRDEGGRITVNATRFDGDVRIDGKLDEAIYRQLAPLDTFIQQIPDAGKPASERTEAWIYYDDNNIYVGARVYESVPESEWIANEMRRDTLQLRTNDSFSVMLDTYLDRRNGSAFLVTPIGGFSDFAITNEGDGGRGVNFDWNIVWNSRAGRFDGGWTVEMQIPFRSLRYEPGQAQTWGLQLRRIIRRRNEASYLTEVPIAAARGNSLVSGMWRISDAATLNDLQVPARKLNLEVKPYGLGGVTTNREARPPTHNERSTEAGVDVKLGITNNLTADFTYNTDFAQVEVDERQVNLTRFNQLFPEKREFFLEGRGNFDFTQPRGLEVPTMFFSRRIGLEQGQIVPIGVGARLTGKIGDYEVGGLTIDTDASGLKTLESSRFSILRVKRDVFRRSTVGMMVTDRSESVVGDGSNQLVAIDGSFDFLQNLSFDTYVANTRSPGLKKDDSSYMANLAWDGDRYGFNTGYVVVENNFNPEIGFKRRNNFRQFAGGARFSPRPVASDWIRRFNLEATTQSFWSATTDQLESRQNALSFSTEFTTSDIVSLSISDEFEMLTRPFRISPGVTLRPGKYDFTSYQASYSFGAQRPMSGVLSLRKGDFWTGTITTIGFSSGRIELSPQLSVEPAYSINKVELPEGDFRTELASLRLTYTLTPRMYLSGLVQYDSSASSFSSNLRFRWEWAPGSELFVVYSDDRNTDPLGHPSGMDLRNRGFVIKANKLFQL